MALEENIQTFSYVADGPLDQFTIVAIDPANPRGCTQADGVLPPLGTVNNHPTELGQATTVVQSGIARVKCGGTIAIGAAVLSDANGLAISGAAGPLALGIAITAGVINEIIEVQLK